MPTGQYKRQRRVVYQQFTCRNCGIEFEVSPGSVKQRQERVGTAIQFCSNACRKGTPRAEYVERKCATCSGVFKIIASHDKDGHGQFCSRRCFAKSRRVDGAKWRDPQQIKAYMKEYRARHRATLNAKVSERNASQPERARQRRKKWRDAHPGYSVAATAKRRTHLRGNGGKFTLAEWQALKAKHDYRCLACGAKEPDIKLSADHVISVAAGGSSAITNIQPLCQPCNTRKFKGLTDYRRQQQSWIER